MLKFVVAAGAGALLLSPSLGAAATADPASSLRSTLESATLIQQAQYCRCGSYCYRRDHYGRCISWRCRACYPPYRYRYYRYYRY